MRTPVINVHIQDTTSEQDRHTSQQGLGHHMQQVPHTHQGNSHEGGLPKAFPTSTMLTITVLIPFPFPSTCAHKTTPLTESHSLQVQDQAMGYWQAVPGSTHYMIEEPNMPRGTQKKHITLHCDVFIYPSRYPIYWINNCSNDLGQNQGHLVPVKLVGVFPVNIDRHLQTLFR